ncbi:Peptidase family S41 [compost metagenome]
MKKIIVFLLFALSQTIFGQVKLTETQKLATTCKVWGFLKYYHPAVASGTTNWDKQLFDVLPQIEKAQTKEEFSAVIENWIISLGEVKTCTTCSDNNKTDDKYFYKNLDLLWIKSTKLFSTNLSNKLEFIRENRFQGNQFYVDEFEAKHIFLKNENYSNFKWEDRNQRLLSLFRYWNVIEYFFPYKYIMDYNWDTTLQEAIPDFVNIKTEEDFQLAMLKVVVRLNDSHAMFYFKRPQDKNKQRNFLPVNSKIIDKKMVVTEILSDSIAKLDDIRVGDVIIKINDKSIEEIIEEKKNYISASNESAYLKNLLLQITTGYSDTINFESVRDGKITEKTIKWYDYNVSHSNEFKKNRKIEKYKILEKNIGYVNMGKIRINEISAMMDKLFHTKAIVFDMRNYPNGTNYEISKYLNSKETPFAKYTYPDLTYPGRFIWTESDTCGSDNPNYYRGRVIVLVNEYSISQSEWATMSFQTAANTTVIGSQTAGADGNVCHIDFVKDYEAPFSGVGVYYPDGKETQRIGIIPDIEVKPTIIGIQQGRDEVLERAIQFIETGK